MFLSEHQPWLCRRRSHHYSCVFCLPFYFFRAQSEDSLRAGFRVFGILSIDLNDASQKGKFHSRIVEQLGWDCFPAA
jgi:hypothetical protein